MSIDPAVSPPWVALAVLGALVAIAVLVVCRRVLRTRGGASGKPQHPLWKEPREFFALFDRELFDDLHPRLELMSQDERASLWRDKTTGQLWSAVAYDHEFTQDVVYTPIRDRNQWLGMPKGH